MLSCDVQLARPDAGIFDHWSASCCFAFSSSFMQLFTDWSTVRPVAAAASSLQLRAMSKFGTPSATATTICELKTIIEKEIGISRLLQIAAKASARPLPSEAAAPAYRKTDRGATGRFHQNASAAGRRDGEAYPGIPRTQASSRRVGAFLTAGLEQEPGTAFGLVDEQFEQLGGTRVLIVIGQLVRLPHRGRHVLVVF